jgi:hypothetical protein
MKMERIYYKNKLQQYMPKSYKTPTQRKLMSRKSPKQAERFCFVIPTTDELGLMLKIMIMMMMIMMNSIVYFLEQEVTT